MIQTTTPSLKDRILEYYYDEGNNPLLKHIDYMRGTPFHLLDDAIQESAMNAIKKQNQYDSTRPLENWLFTIFLNRCIDLQRKEYRHCPNETDSICNLGLSKTQRLLEEQEGYEPPPEQPSNEEDKKRILMQAISSLSPEQQQLITEHYFNGKLKYRELANKLNIPTGTTKSRTSYALKNLRDILTPHKEELMFE